MDAFGVERGDIAKKARTLKAASKLNSALRFDRAGRMFGSHKKADGTVIDSAFTRGQKKGWKKGYGPMKSGFRGLVEAAEESPGTAAAAGVAGVGGLAGTGYLAGKMRRND